MVAGPDRRDLISAAEAGDREAQQELLELIRVLARAVCDRYGVAKLPVVGWEDVAQEASYAILSMSPDQYRDERNYRGFVYVVVRNTCLRMVRAARRRASRETSHTERLVVHAGVARRVDVRRQVMHALASLDESCRDLLRRVFLEDVPIADLAREFGLAQPSVRSRVSRCVSQARARSNDG
jgi:RNA polymerase sigma factor (sigma-70 family)